MQPDPNSGGETAVEASKSFRTDRWALIFGCLVLVSVPLYLDLGRGQWFFHDDWDFLAERTGGNLDDLLRAHNGH